MFQTTNQIILRRQSNRQKCKLGTFLRWIRVVIHNLEMSQPYSFGTPPVFIRFEPFCKASQIFNGPRKPPSEIISRCVKNPDGFNNLCKLHYFLPPLPRTDHRNAHLAPRTDKLWLRKWHLPSLNLVSKITPRLVDLRL